MILTYLPYYEEFDGFVPYTQLVQIRDTEDSPVYHCFVWTRASSHGDAKFWKKNRSTQTELYRWCSFGHPKQNHGSVDGLRFSVSMRHYNIGCISVQDLQQINAKQLLQQEFTADVRNLSLLLVSIITYHSRALQEREINDKRNAVSKLTPPCSRIGRSEIRPHVDRDPVYLRGTDAIPASTRISLDDL